MSKQGESRAEMKARFAAEHELEVEKMRKTMRLNTEDACWSYFLMTVNSAQMVEWGSNGAIMNRPHRDMIIRAGEMLRQVIKENERRLSGQKHIR